MTEEKWLPCTDPEPMLAFIRNKPAVRKLRLFAVAACRLIGHRFTDERSRRALDAAERYADGLIDNQEREEAWTAAYEAYTDAKVADGLEPEQDVPPETSGLLPYVAYQCVDDDWGNDAAGWAICAHTHATILGGHPELCDLLRCVFGNPFHPVAFDLTWRTPTVHRLAETIYQERAFDRLPVLGDALEDAGCTDAALLSHIRPAVKQMGGWRSILGRRKRPAVHARGCWVVDCVLGK